MVLRGSACVGFGACRGWLHPFFTPQHTPGPLENEWALAAREVFTMASLIKRGNRYYIRLYVNGKRRESLLCSAGE
jgi:hypothetical protein